MLRIDEAVVAGHYRQFNAKLNGGKIYSTFFLFHLSTSQTGEQDREELRYSEKQRLEQFQVQQQIQTITAQLCVIHNCYVLIYRN